MFHMFILIFGINKDVINENHDEFIQLRHKYGIHKVHEVGWCIRETKRHNQEFI
jgi:hypothetical protein